MSGFDKEEICRLFCFPSFWMISLNLFHMHMKAWIVSLTWLTFNFVKMTLRCILNSTYYCMQMILLFFAENELELQAALNAMFLYCKSWDLEVNPAETKITIFSHKKLNNVPRFKYDGHDLEVEDIFVYLGNLFTYNGRFLKNSKRLLDQARKAVFCSSQVKKAFPSCWLTITTFWQYGCSNFNVWIWSLWFWKKHCTRKLMPSVLQIYP